jgi:hypothetical protein
MTSTFSKLSGDTGPASVQLGIEDAREAGQHVIVPAHRKRGVFLHDKGVDQIDVLLWYSVL